MVGIYAIRNVTKNKYYIGSSENIDNRILCHMTEIDKGYWDEDVRNGDHFESIVLKELYSSTELESYENYYIGKYDSIKNGYNKVLARRKPVIKIIDPFAKQKANEKKITVPLLTPVELMELLKIDIHQYKELIKVEGFPFYKLLGTSLRFKLDEIEKWIDNQRKG